jgi:peptidyl-dipeptidase A
MSEMWLAGYDDETANWTAVAFKKQMLNTWEELRPYYNKLHAYVRMKLRRIPEYADRITKYGNLPAHLLGNMWAQVMLR